MGRTLIISDLHLGACNSNTAAIDDLLGSRFDRLILNGDVLDHHDVRRYTSAHWSILNRLRRLAERNRVILIRGNHDADPGWEGTEHGKQQLVSGLVGCELRESIDLRVNGLKYLVTHGDRFDRTMNLTWVGNVADMIYRGVQRINRPAARWLKAQSKKRCGVVDAVRKIAVDHARAAGYDGVILGHTHFPADEIAPGVRDIHYLNSGCWVDEPCHYIEVTDERMAVRVWPHAVPEPLVVLPRPEVLVPMEATA
jgi:UDP-2,3-diacylglucosamine pyrophosphatase LpxH